MLYIVQYDVAFTFKNVNKVIKCDQSYSRLWKWFQRLRFTDNPKQVMLWGTWSSLEKSWSFEEKANGSLERGNRS